MTLDNCVSILLGRLIKSYESQKISLRGLLEGKINTLWTIPDSFACGEP